MASEFVVGVDIGSSDARAVAIDRAGTVLATGRSGYGAGYDPADGVVDPAGWLNGAAGAVRSIDIGIPIALGIGGHSPTTVASTGEMAVTFRHPSGAASSPVDQHAAHAEVIQNELGSDVEPRLAWDYIAARFGGDAGVQSVWADMDPLPGFGDPVPVGRSVGTSTGAHGIPAGIALVPGSNDAYMTVWASGIDTPGKAFDPGGKAGGLGIAVSVAGHEDLAQYGLPSHVPGVYVIGGPTASHGALLDWWSSITGRGVADLIALAAGVPEGSLGVTVLPYMEGERAPRWNRDLRGEIVGLSLDVDVAVLTRAILEGTAYGLGHIARSLGEKGATLERVVSSGTPSKSPLWIEIKAAVLEVPIDVPACSEMAAYGAALAAGAGVGWWPRPGQGGPGDWPMPAVTTVKPTPSDVYRRGLDRFIALGDEATERIATNRVGS